jgi:hypothetical protein
MSIAGDATAFPHRNVTMLLPERFEAAGMPEPTSVEVLETHNIEQR